MSQQATNRINEFESPVNERPQDSARQHLDILADRPIHIVAIDDEPSAIAVLEAACAIAGFRMSSTNDPHQGLQLVREQEPDVVLLDVMMPGITGFEVCAKLKNDAQTQLVPVILITALDSREDRIRGIEAGCDDFITKPVDRLELTARVRAVGPRSCSALR